MQIGGIAWWLLLGMFGFGAAAGILISFLVIKVVYKPEPSNECSPCVALILMLILAAVAAPLAGIAAVVLTFAAHHAGWDGPLPYLAGIGLVFLTLLAGVVLQHLYHQSLLRRRTSEIRRSTGRRS